MPKLGHGSKNLTDHQFVQTPFANVEDRIQNPKVNDTVENACLIKTIQEIKNTVTGEVQGELQNFFGAELAATILKLKQRYDIFCFISIEQRYSQSFDTNGLQFSTDADRTVSTSVEEFYHRYGSQFAICCNYRRSIRIGIQIKAASEQQQKKILAQIKVSRQKAALGSSLSIDLEKLKSIQGTHIVISSNGDVDNSFFTLPFRKQS